MYIRKVAFKNFKASVRYFLSNFYFSPNDSSLKSMKNVFYFIKKTLFLLEIFKFLHFCFPLFFPVGHCFRGWSKKNPKFYDVVSFLNKNLITHFVWYLEKEIGCDIETLSIDRIVNKEHFLEKSCRKCVSNASLRSPFLILLNNPKEPLHARNSFKNKIF